MDNLPTPLMHERSAAEPEDFDLLAELDKERPGGQRKLSPEARATGAEPKPPILAGNGSAHWYACPYCACPINPPPTAAAQHTDAALERAAQLIREKHPLSQPIGEWAKGYARGIIDAIEDVRSLKSAPTETDKETK